MGGSNLQETEEERDLGVIIDNKLDFESHIHEKIPLNEVVQGIL